MSNEKINQKIIADLFSPGTTKVLSAIESIRNTGNHLYLPVLFDILLSRPAEEIETNILLLLGNVKEKASAVTFVEAIQNDKYQPVLKKLLTACWQNGLDYSPYLSVFAEVVIKEDWETGFEAFTVIENLEFWPDEKTMEEIAVRIRNALGSATGQKAYLLQEILTLAGKS